MSLRTIGSSPPRGCRKTGGARLQPSGLAKRHDALVLEPVFVDKDSVRVPAPLTHQRRAGLEHDTGINGAFL